MPSGLINSFKNMDNPSVFIAYLLGDIGNGRDFYSEVELTGWPNIGGIFTPPSNPPPATNLDNLLAYLTTNFSTDNVMVVGGPFANSLALLLQSPGVQNSLSSQFQFGNIAADGTAFLDDAPYIQIGSTKYQRTLSQDQTTITDYAFIGYFAGTTNSLLYVAGIRDFGTLYAATMLDYASFALHGIDQTWFHQMDTQTTCLIQFSYPASLNNESINFFSIYVNNLESNLSIPATIL